MEFTQFPSFRNRYGLHEVLVKLIIQAATISRVAGMEESTFNRAPMVVSRHQILAGY